MPLIPLCLVGNKFMLLPWIILFFASLNVIFLGGKRRAFGSFVAVLRKDYENTTLSELNWIGNSYAAVAYVTSSVSTTAILYFKRRYGASQFIGSVFILLSSMTSAIVPNPHWLFLTCTVFHGIGSSLVISTIGLVVIEHFDRDHPFHILATTLVSGGSLAAVLFVYFFAYLIDKYDWRASFLIIGAVYFVINSSAAVFFVRNEHCTELEVVKIPSMLRNISSNQIPLLILWFIDRVITSVVTYGLLLNLTDFVYRSQHNLIRSSILTTLFAAGEGSTYFLAAVITATTRDFFNNKLGYILLVCSMIAGVTLMTTEFTSHMVTTTRVLCCITGLAIGPSNTLLFPAGEELTMLPGPLAYPFSLGGMGLGMILSPLLTAKIAEAFAYDWFFFVQGCLMFIKVVCLFSILVLLAYVKGLDMDEKYHSFETATEQTEVKSSEENSKLIPVK